MNKKIVYIVVGVIVLAGAFYGGMVYGKSQTPARTAGAQAFGQNGAFNGTRGTRGAFGGATTGQILSKDATSITVGITGGGSKIIFLDSSTPITKQASGTLTDLAVGTEVSVVGTANTDGSISAQSVQIRPKISAPSATTSAGVAPTTTQ